MKNTLTQLALGNGAILLGLLGITSANLSVLRYIFTTPLNYLNWGFLLLVLLFLSGVVSVLLGIAVIGRVAYRTVAQ
ncbi:hypothetical protein [Haladaptatus cibarius]|uniref:hypothetical protein n=1 Tax=Haladaptatus cibarius TaxID=453847 RepID=UPI000678FE30|nr:hypothetical protein [Haladaptatus cibarius]